MERIPLAIIGAGPAGLSAAIYTARAGIDTMIFGCAPKIAGDYDIDNYFGFEETITGKELMERGKRQAERFGAISSCERVLSIHQQERRPLSSENRRARGGSLRRDPGHGSFARTAGNQQSWGIRGQGRILLRQL